MNFNHHIATAVIFFLITYMGVGAFPTESRAETKALTKGGGAMDSGKELRRAIEHRADLLRKSGCKHENDITDALMPYFHVGMPTNEAINLLKSAGFGIYDRPILSARGRERYRVVGQLSHIIDFATGAGDVVITLEPAEERIDTTIERVRAAIYCTSI